MLGVALQRVVVVELIGEEGARLGLQLGDARAEPIEQRRRHRAAVARHHLDVGAERPHRLDLLAREGVGRERREL